MDAEKSRTLQPPAAVVFVSGGLASWATAMLARKAYKGRIVYLFNDTLTEDADLYRFLIEGLCIVLKVKKPAGLLGRCRALPGVDSDQSIEVRRRELAEIRAEAMARLPGFIWQCDGRTPWEAWEANSFIGNSRVAHCSIDLKAVMGDRWIKQNAGPNTVQEFGMYWDEGGRIERLRKLKGQPIGQLLYESGLTHSDIAEMAAAAGLKVGRSYGAGFAHDNCSGLCCRAGKKHWAMKYAQNPAEARYFAGKEAELLATVPGGLPMIKEERQGKPYGVPLNAFLDRLDAERPAIDSLDDLGSGCGCTLAAIEQMAESVAPQ